MSLYRRPAALPTYGAYIGFRYLTSGINTDLGTNLKQLALFSLILMNWPIVVMTSAITLPVAATYGLGKVVCGFIRKSEQNHADKVKAARARLAARGIPTHG